MASAGGIVRKCPTLLRQPLASAGPLAHDSRPCLRPCLAVRPFLIALIIIAIVAAIGSGVHEWHSRPPAKPPARTGEAFTGRPRVVDGDSLELAGHRVRLFGIDAPESMQDCRDARGRTYACGREARDGAGRRLSADRACHARRSAKATTATSRCAPRTAAISARRWCVRDTRWSLRQHSRGRYGDAEREARNARRGLWAGDFERPSQWRQAHPR